MHLFIGIHGSVLAIDRATGDVVWQSHLGGDFINVVLDGREIYAATKGELYRLDPASGRILWQNKLKGMGVGLITIAQSLDGNRGVMKKQQSDEEDAAAASTTAAIT